MGWWGQGWLYWFLSAKHQRLSFGARFGIPIPPGERERGSVVLQESPPPPTDPQGPLNGLLMAAVDSAFAWFV